MIQIIKNAPLPQKNVGANRKHQDLYDLAETWEVGDSVVFDADGVNTHGTKVSSRANALNGVVRKFNQKIAVRSNQKDSTVQVWRVQ
jgi:hypothetical protein